ncbi:hypothetical protein PATA110616_17960 [Paenibacillus tarimensis]
MTGLILVKRGLILVRQVLDSGLAMPNQKAAPLVYFA